MLQEIETTLHQADSPSSSSCRTGEGPDLQCAPFMLEFLPASSRRCLCRCEYQAVQKHVEPRLKEVRQRLTADLERWDNEFRNAYNACTVELLFGLACSTVLWRQPSLCLLVFPVIGEFSCRFGQPGLHGALWSEESSCPTQSEGNGLSAACPWSSTFLVAPQPNSQLKAGKSWYPGCAEVELARPSVFKAFELGRRCAGPCHATMADGMIAAGAL
eukprot:symbB.v1.2.041301.t2/scaffold8033.1/size8113/1